MNLGLDGGAAAATSPSAGAEWLFVGTLTPHRRVWQQVDWTLIGTVTNSKHNESESNESGTSTSVAMVAEIMLMC